MGFSTKAKQYFHQELNLTNREISARMGNYSETLVSRYLKSDKVSATFVLKLKKCFPDAPVDSWLQSDIVEEVAEVYQVDSIKRINRIINELEELKKEFKKITQK